MKLGIAADHGGYEIKEKIAGLLRSMEHSVKDFGAYNLSQGDDYPDFVIPLARAAASGEIDRGIAICGSGVGASVAANKIPGARAALIHDCYSARQGVEDDNINVICFGGRVMGYSLIKELTQIFLKAEFSGAERHKRRLEKVAKVEMKGENKMATGKMNPLIKIGEYLQSIWLDNLSRQMIQSGKLKKLIDEDGLSGITSNPAIFEKAIVDSEAYLSDIRSLAMQGKSKEKIYEELTIRDIQDAADLLFPVFEKAQGQDGFVSLEVSPYLAHKTEDTIKEAHHLWERVNRPNVLIKVPAITESIPAIRQLISDGININITLLFGLDRYREVIEAYFSALEERIESGRPLNHIASVASFFLSRIDVMVDPMLEKIANDGGKKGELAKSLIGQIAVSCAKVAYRIFQEQFESDRYRELLNHGAHVQRLLWASTGTKNPAYSDIKYIEPLIGPDTINTMPEKTLEAYRDHGNPELRLEKGVDQAFKALHQLKELGIDMDKVTGQLETEAVDKFIKPYDKLMQTLQNKVKGIQEKNLAR
ncbi:MAG TPA: transaldolase [Ignavibacteriales bacterium]|nr:transaldolase [Ignavibacteriales bacterium]